eukprot:TRINITY_DN3422_c0_g1_i1.p1 TRINITY_DN3422_c0_g1~~TRINITY_DN3422_c0_g1_i1.p1  ORF type:complete len:207 (+),score=47.01 TRINITY_DN3422_c0_g1_i1:191-811(+)
MVLGASCVALPCDTFSSRSLDTPLSELALLWAGRQSVFVDSLQPLLLCHKLPEILQEFCVIDEAVVRVHTDACDPAVLAALRYAATEIVELVRDSGSGRYRAHTVLKPARLGAKVQHRTEVFFYRAQDRSFVAEAAVVVPEAAAPSTAATEAPQGKKVVLPWEHTEEREAAPFSAFEITGEADEEEQEVQDALVAASLDPDADLDL